MLRSLLGQGCFLDRRKENLCNLKRNISPINKQNIAVACTLTKESMLIKLLAANAKSLSNK